MLTVLVLISEGFWWRSGTDCHMTMCSVWYTACAGDVQLALLHVVALPTIDVMSQYNDYEVHYECFIPNVSRIKSATFGTIPPVYILLRGH